MFPSQPTRIPSVTFEGLLRKHAQSSATLSDNPEVTPTGANEDEISLGPTLIPPANDLKKLPKMDTSKWDPPHAFFDDKELPPLPPICDPKNFALFASRSRSSSPAFPLLSMAQLKGHAMMSLRLLDTLNPSGDIDHGLLLHLRQAVCRNGSLACIATAYGLDRLIKIHPGVDVAPQKVIGDAMRAFVYAAVVDAQARGHEGVVNHWLDNIFSAKRWTLNPSPPRVGGISNDGKRVFAEDPSISEDAQSQPIDTPEPLQNENRPTNTAEIPVPETHHRAQHKESSTKIYPQNWSDLSIPDPWNHPFCPVNLLKLPSRLELPPFVGLPLVNWQQHRDKLKSAGSEVLYAAFRKSVSANAKYQQTVPYIAGQYRARAVSSFLARFYTLENGFMDLFKFEGLDNQTHAAEAFWVHIGALQTGAQKEPKMKQAFDKWMDSLTSPKAWPQMVATIRKFESSAYMTNSGKLITEPPAAIAHASFEVPTPLTKALKVSSTPPSWSKASPPTPIIAANLPLRFPLKTAKLASHIENHSEKNLRAYAKSGLLILGKTLRPPIGSMIVDYQGSKQNWFVLVSNSILARLAVHYKLTDPTDKSPVSEVRASRLFKRYICIIVKDAEKQGNRESADEWIRKVFTPTVFLGLALPERKRPEKGENSPSGPDVAAMTEKIFADDPEGFASADSNPPVPAEVALHSVSQDIGHGDHDGFSIGATETDSFVSDGTATPLSPQTPTGTIIDCSSSDSASSSWASIKVASKWIVPHVSIDLASLPALPCSRDELGGVCQKAYDRGKSTRTAFCQRGRQSFELALKQSIEPHCSNPLSLNHILAAYTKPEITSYLTVHYEFIVPYPKQAKAYLRGGQGYNADVFFAHVAALQDSVSPTAFDQWMAELVSEKVWPTMRDEARDHIASNVSEESDAVIAKATRWASIEVHDDRTVLAPLQVSQDSVASFPGDEASTDGKVTNLLSHVDTALSEVEHAVSNLEPLFLSHNLPPLRRIEDASLASAFERDSRALFRSNLSPLADSKAFIDSVTRAAMKSQSRQSLQSDLHWFVRQLSVAAMTQHYNLEHESTASLPSRNPLGRSARIFRRYVITLMRDAKLQGKEEEVIDWLAQIYTIENWPEVKRMVEKNRKSKVNAIDTPSSTSVDIADMDLTPPYGDSNSITGTHEASANTTGHQLSLATINMSALQHEDADSGARPEDVSKVDRSNTVVNEQTNFAAGDDGQTTLASGDESALLFVRPELDLATTPTQSAVDETTHMEAAVSGRNGKSAKVANATAPKLQPLIISSTARKTIQSLPFD